MLLGYITLLLLFKLLASYFTIMTTQNPFNMIPYSLNNTLQNRKSSTTIPIIC